MAKKPSLSPDEVFPMPTLLRTLLVALIVVLATASCSTNPAPLPLEPGGTPCVIGTQVQLSNPLPGTQGVPTTIGQVQIVVNASSNVLGTAWDMVLLDVATNVSQGPLTLSPTPGTYKPFANNFYYQSTVPPLFSQDIYQVYLIKPAGACAPALVGAFTTQ